MLWFVNVFVCFKCQHISVRFGVKLWLWVKILKASYFSSVRLFPLYMTWFLIMCILIYLYSFLRYKHVLCGFCDTVICSDWDVVSCVWDPVGSFALPQKDTAPPTGLSLLCSFGQPIIGAPVWFHSAFARIHGEEGASVPKRPCGKIKTVWWECCRLFYFFVYVFQWGI